MTALERIKEIEAELERRKASVELLQAIYKGTPQTELVAAVIKHDSDLRSLDPEFLLRSFKVMRGIAMELKQDLEVSIANGNIRVPMWIYVEDHVDAEFEKRMAEGKC